MNRTWEETTPTGILRASTSLIKFSESTVVIAMGMAQAGISFRAVLRIFLLPE